MGVTPTVRLDGIADLIGLLRETDAAAFGVLMHELEKVGDLVRDDARQRLVEKFGARVEATASGFETRVRPGVKTLQRDAIVVVGQSRRKTTGRRPDWGYEQVRYGLIPARSAKIEEAQQLVEDGIVALLREHGF